jgi:hypothetical protein
VDPFVVRYLRSGRAWVIVGSGPSAQLGYPSWARLAETAIAVARAERPDFNLDRAVVALAGNDYPLVLQFASEALGRPRLREVLRDILKPARPFGSLYRIIARWPVPVYLTTNYDDALARHLAEFGLAYRDLGNSQDDFALLVPDLDGAIVRLHGSLERDAGLVLTRRDYAEIETERTWRYWRTKMSSVIQMVPLVVIGHSLTDTNIRHVLELAKEGSGVTQPVCWIAPDVPPDHLRDLLEKHRLRVLTYDNSAGDHRNLEPLLAQISAFIPPRTAVGITRRIERIVEPGTPDAAAAAVYVFNRLETLPDIAQKRRAVLEAALDAAIEHCSPGEELTLQQALQAVGWPATVAIPPEIGQGVLEASRAAGRIDIVDGLIRTRGHSASRDRGEFVHLRERFLAQIALRVRRDYPDADEEVAAGIAGDVDRALTGYFLRGGLTLATTLFAERDRPEGAIPPFILTFVIAASTQYPDYLRRQMFSSASIQAFSQASSAEREYLGRLSQGFFAFHALGAFGEAASERLRTAASTVWLIDSSAQIPALALASPAQGAFRTALTRLHAAGIRFFTTLKLFNETWTHLSYASSRINQFGPESPYIVAAALGEPPFASQNVFLQGYLRWQAAGNPPDWPKYMFECFGERRPTREAVGHQLAAVGLEIVDFQDWPGFVETDFAERETYSERLLELARRRRNVTRIPEEKLEEWLRGKVVPEAEAFVIVQRERGGKYFMLSAANTRSPAFFVSATSAINLLGGAIRTTWQPEAFLAFAGTVFTELDESSADRAFETLLWNLAESGVTVLADEEVERVLGAFVDPSTLRLEEQRQAVEETLGKRYGESPREILARLPPSTRGIGAVQLNTQLVEQQRQMLADTRQRAREGERARQELDAVGRYRRKVAEKAAQEQKRKRRASAKRKAGRKR